MNGPGSRTSSTKQRSKEEYDDIRHFVDLQAPPMSYQMLGSALSGCTSGTDVNKEDIFRQQIVFWNISPHSQSSSTILTPSSSCWYNCLILSIVAFSGVDSRYLSAFVHSFFGAYNTTFCFNIFLPRHFNICQIYPLILGLLSSHTPIFCSNSAPFVTPSSILHLLESLVLTTSSASSQPHLTVSRSLITGVVAIPILVKAQGPSPPRHHSLQPILRNVKQRCPPLEPASRLPRSHR